MQINCRPIVPVKKLIAKLRFSMTRLFSALILLAVFSFSSAFYQQFYIPKLIVFYAMAIACLVFLATRRQLLLPSTKVLLFLASFLLLAAIPGIRSVAPLTGFMQWSYYLGGGLLFIVLINFERAALEILLKTVFIAALAQIILLVPQFLLLQGYMPAALTGQHGHLFGTTGNQEFLSTLLGVGFFIGLHFLEQTAERKKRALLFAANAALLLAMLLAQNKGGLLFIGLYFLWKKFPGYRLILLIGIGTLLIAVFVFPTSIKGRVLLWLAASTIFIQNFTTGVGLLQLENQYLDVVHQLFSAHPALSEMFGSYTATAMDAHNIILQFGVSLGISGLILAFLFAGYVLRLTRENHNHLGVALLFLLFKSLYTVVLSSITGMILFVLLLAILSQKRSVRLDGIARRALVASAPAIALIFFISITLSTSDYFYQQGARALFMGQNEQATASLNRALAINSENADAWLALAQASYLQSDYPGMRSHLEQALAYRKNKDTLKIAASMYFYAKQYDEAFRLYRYLHLAFPQHLTSMTKLASIYIIRHEYDKAYTMAQVVLHTDPRKRAASDDRNIRIATQIAADSYPFTTQPDILKATPGALNERKAP